MPQLAPYCTGGEHWLLGVPPFMDVPVVPSQLHLDWGAPIDPLLRMTGPESFERKWEGGTASFDCRTAKGELVPASGAF